MTRTTSLILLGLSSALCVLGCDPDSESVGEAESSSGVASGGIETDPSGGEPSTGETAGESQTSGLPTSGPTSGTPTTGEPTTGAPTTGGECDVDTCGPCPPPLQPTQECEGGQPLCTCEYAGECALDSILGEALNADPTAADDAVNCGVATLSGTLEEWTAVRDCALAASSNGTAFIASFEAESIDSVIFNGYVGLTTPEYNVTSYWSDDFVGQLFIDRSDCGLLQDLDGCTLDVGQTCFSCSERTDFLSFCEVEPK